MKMTFTTKNIPLTEKMQAYAEKKLGKLDKFVAEDTQVNVVMRREKGGRDIVEATIYLPGVVLRAEETTDDLFKSIDLVADKLIRQIRRHRTRLEKRLREGAQYDFDFALLDRWVDTARRAGMVWFEMAHLFSQWGAKAAPKIVATVDGEEKRIFGWDTPADSAEYRDFLAQYLTALCAHLRALGVADRCFFHISDEPSSDHLDLYRSARESVEPYVKGFAIVDALSDYSFYQTGAVTTPVVATNHIQPFIDAGVPGLWCYYCVSQNRLVSNMFMAMPSARNRILGVQLYLYRIAGFLHWGYNFYHSQYSRSVINPYLVTDGDGFSPSGDPFIVYPGPGGVPEESIRLMVTAEALQDLRALTWLEQLRGREFVEQLIGADITFDRYPKGADFVLSLRRRVNEAIVAAQK